MRAEPADVLAWFVRRWTAEVTFAEAHRHLGIEMQRQWSDKAIARTTPALLGLYSIVALAADDMQGQDKLAVRSAGWYQKDKPTFSDALATVRRQLWTEAAFSISPSSTDGEKVPLAIFNRLADLACYAA